MVVVIASTIESAQEKKKRRKDGPSSDAIECLHRSDKTTERGVATIVHPSLADEYIKVARTETNRLWNESH